MTSRLRPLSSVMRSSYSLVIFSISLLWLLCRRFISALRFLAFSASRFSYSSRVCLILSSCALRSEAEIEDILSSQTSGYHEGEKDTSTQMCPDLKSRLLSSVQRPAHERAASTVDALLSGVLARLFLFCV